MVDTGHSVGGVGKEGMGKVGTGTALVVVVAAVDTGLGLVATVAVDAAAGLLEADLAAIALGVVIACTGPEGVLGNLVGSRGTIGSGLDTSFVVAF